MNDLSVPYPNSTARTAAIVEFLASHPEQTFTLTEVARSCGLQKSTAYKFLGTLHELGWVTRSPSDLRYGLGPTLIAVGQAAVETRPEVNLARPVMERIAIAFPPAVRAHHHAGVRDPGAGSGRRYHQAERNVPWAADPPGRSVRYRLRRLAGQRSAPGVVRPQLDRRFERDQCTQKAPDRDPSKGLCRHVALRSQGPDGADHARGIPGTYDPRRPPDPQGTAGPPASCGLSDGQQSGPGQTPSRVHSGPHLRRRWGGPLRHRRRGSRQRLGVRRGLEIRSAGSGAADEITAAIQMHAHPRLGRSRAAGRGRPHPPEVRGGPRIPRAASFPIPSPDRARPRAAGRYNHRAR